MQVNVLTLRERKCLEFLGDFKYMTFIRIGSVFVKILVSGKLGVEAKKKKFFSFLEIKLGSLVERYIKLDTFTI